MKSLIEYIEKLGPFIGGYPLWFQYSLAVWTVLTALLLIGLVLLNPGSRGSKQPPATGVDATDVESLNVQLKKLVQTTLAVPAPLAERYADVVKSPGAGITKLLSDGSKLENAIRGGGTYWAFLRLDHEYGQGSDIQLQGSQFATGFAGANYGYFLRLGKAPIRQVLDTAGPAPPSWLESGRHEAWKYMWEYVPPRNMDEIRQHQSGSRGLVKGNATLSETTPAIAEEAYLLRSIQVGDSDVLVALQVVERNDDGSVIIVWKAVRVFDTPVAEEDDDGVSPDQIVFDGRGKIDGFSIKGGGGTHWEGDWPNARPIGNEGEGVLTFEEGGVLNLMRTNTDGRYVLVIQEYDHRDQKESFLPKDGLLTGKRKLTISCQAKVPKEAHTLRFVINATSGEQLAGEERQISRNAWAPITVYLLAPPTEDVEVRIYDMTTSPSSIQIKDLVVTQRSN